LPRLSSIYPKLDWLLLLILVFIPRLLNLDVFLTPDEPLFLKHAREFAAGLSSRDWSLTLGIGYPGVTVAWWAAPVVGSAQSELGAYVAGRVMTVWANGLMLLVLFGVARFLSGHRPAFLGVTLLALDPYMMAYSRLLHNEVSLTLFMTLAGLCWLLWLRQSSARLRTGSGVGNKASGRRWLLLSGLFTGLAFLTKSTALLLGPMLIALLGGWLLADKFSASAASPKYDSLPSLFYPLFRGLIGLAAVALFSIIIFFAVWPAMWTMPGQALDLTFGKLLNDQEAGTGNMGFFWMGRFIQDPGPFFYPVAFVLKATPWLLAGLIVSLGLLITKRHTPATKNTVLTSIPLWFFALTYLILMTIASKKSVRYLLPAFPTFYLLAGLAFYQISGSLGRWIRTKPQVAAGLFRTFSSFPRSLAPLLLFLPLTLFTLIYHPYYFTYYNPLLLGWLWAPQTLLVGWGEGLDGAARYLNQKPASTVSAWYNWIFPVLYHGQVQSPSVRNLITADHAVLYLNQVQRDLPNPHLIHYFRTRRKPEYTVRLNGIEYAWVYPGPIIGVRPDPAPQSALGGTFGGEVRLLGYDLSQPALSGQPLIVTLYWRVLATPPGDRFVYVRLVDDQGQIWAKSDGPPVLGLWPVSGWQSQLLVEDAQEVPIPPGTPPGTYRLEVGWYDPATGQPLSAAGQPLGQGGGLLLGQVQLGWQSLSAQPDLPYQTDTRLGPNAHLVGYDTTPATAASGDILSLRLAWREAAPFFDFGSIPNDKVRFEWQQHAQPLAEQLDPLPLPIAQWGRQALLLSQHQVVVPAALSTGRYELVVMLHTGSNPAGPAFTLGTVEVTSPPHQFELPATANPPIGPAQLEQGVTLAGFELHQAGAALNLNLFWQTQLPLMARYKVFAQLLGPNNAVVGQSDSFPGAGQRPTTGWLPGEIIADSHTLTFTAPPAAGAYRLIAGLYNPLTGQRLSLVNGQGDTILLAQVNLP
jgi:4-amino-4-deoxy-L-arabinose transferase-like glycosyltransferase